MSPQHFYYAYVLQSTKDNEFYSGSTSNLKKRLQSHNNGLIKSTRNRRPLNLIYYEAMPFMKRAKEREKYFKTSWGKRFIKTQAHRPPQKIE